MLLADERDDEEEDEEKHSLFEKIQAAFPLLMAWLYKHKDFTYESMTDEEVQSFVRKVSDYFDHAVDTSIRQVPMAEVSVQRLKESNYVFSGIKVFHELNEAFPSMLDDNNELRPFEDFLKDVQKVNNTYNGSYLRTEYNFARQSSLMAARWKHFEKDGERYNLQYRTAYDDRVRTSHRKLEGITLPPSSKFWNDYFPPNGWNCRCTVVQVRKDKYPESNEREAINLGSQATAGKHQEMFKFNPGIAMTTFPAYNAYTISKCKNCKYNGTLKLAADIPDNELCGACKVVRAMVEANEELKVQRLKIREWAKENLIGKTVLAHKISGPIEFNMAGIKEALNQPHKYIREKNKSLMNIASILKDGEYVQKRLDDKNNPMVYQYHYIKIKIYDKPSYAVIREMKDGRFVFYSIVERLKKKKDD